LWAPIVERYYSAAIGKRKTWIIPMQFIASAILYYLSGNIVEMLEKSESEKIAGILTCLFFFIATQDIAVDGWAAEILYPENSSYASSSQSIGQTMGIFVGGSMFVAFNSLEFCNKYLYPAPQTEPLVTIPGFLYYWSLLIFLTTVFVALFCSEDMRGRSAMSTQKEEEGDPEFSLNKTLEIMLEIIRMPHV
jgi:PAT family acetyl-CoA transporter-like MFS transporter 1